MQCCSQNQYTSMHLRTRRDSKPVLSSTQDFAHTVTSHQLQHQTTNHTAKRLALQHLSLVTMSSSRGNWPSYFSGWLVFDLFSDNINGASTICSCGRLFNSPVGQQWTHCERCTKMCIDEVAIVNHDVCIAACVRRVFRRKDSLCILRSNLQRRTSAFK
jgi:hypothetical protein